MWVLPLLVFSLFAVALSIIDAQRHTLPNRLVLANFIALLSTEVILAMATQSGTTLRVSLEVGLRTMVVFFALLVLSRGQLGMGDVKYALVTGMAIGWTAPELWLTSIWLSFTFAAFWVVAMKRRKGYSSQSQVAFGPFMSLATFLCIVTSQMIL